MVAGIYEKVDTDKKGSLDVAQQHEFSKAMDETVWDKYFNGHWVRPEELLTEFYTFTTAIYGTDGRISADQMITMWTAQRT